MAVVCNESKDVFLDSNIWIELLALRSPQKPHEIVQSRLASNLLKELKIKKVTIFSNYQQLIEITNSIQKVKLREFNAVLKQSGKKGIGSVKEYRNYPEFSEAVEICKIAIDDIQKLVTINNSVYVSIQEILNNTQYIDINDYIYYKYCLDNNLTLYTFDKELKGIDEYNVVNLVYEIPSEMDSDK